MEHLYICGICEPNIFFGRDAEAAGRHHLEFHELPDLQKKLIEVTNLNNKLIKQLLKKIK